MENYNIYLIGGMGKFGKENFDIGDKWRKYLQKKLRCSYGNYKINVWNPNDYYSFLDDTSYDSQREIMEFDLNKVRNSHLCICNFNDVNSLGSMAELTIAYDRRIPIIGLCENGEEVKLHPWQKEMISKMFTDIDKLIYYVCDYYLN